MVAVPGLYCGPLHRQPGFGPLSEFDQVEATDRVRVYGLVGEAGKGETAFARALDFGPYGAAAAAYSHRLACKPKTDPPPSRLDKKYGDVRRVPYAMIHTRRKILMSTQVVSHYKSYYNCCNAFWFNIFWFILLPMLTLPIFFCYRANFESGWVVVMSKHAAEYKKCDIGVTFSRRSRRRRGRLRPGAGSRWRS